MPDRPTEAAESAVPVLVVGLGSDNTAAPALAVALTTDSAADSAAKSQ
jgi:hypothetical protein